MAPAGMVAVTLGAVVSAPPEAQAAVVPTAALTGLTLVPIGGMLVLAIASATALERGAGRVPQTLLALAAIVNPPFGTLYALWVCWYNDGTKARCSPVSAGSVAAWLAFSATTVFGPLVPLLALTVTALLPTDLARLDAEWEPFEDRTRRLPPGPGCGLNETPTASGCAPARPASVRTEEVAFPTRGVAMGFSSLNGTLHVPVGLDGPRPAVILLHGSGPTDRNADLPGEVVSMYDAPLPLFRVLADDLAAQGLVVLRYDKRSCGGCYPAEHAGADYTQFRFAHYIDDAEAAINPAS